MINVGVTILSHPVGISSSDDVVCAVECELLTGDFDERRASWSWSCGGGRGDGGRGGGWMRGGSRCWGCSGTSSLDALAVEWVGECADPSGCTGRRTRIAHVNRRIC